METFTFLYYTNEESDDVIGSSTKQYNTQSRMSLEILKQCSSNLAPETNIIKEGNDNRRAVAMTTVMPLVLFY